MWRRALKRWAWSLVPAFVLLAAIHVVRPFIWPVVTIGTTAVACLVVAAWMEVLATGCGLSVDDGWDKGWQRNKSD